MKKIVLLTAAIVVVLCGCTANRSFTSPTGIEMVFVEGGAFLMGSEDAHLWAVSTVYPAHEVTVSSFYIGKYPVTQREYEAVMGTNPSHFKGDNLPMESVSWYDAVEFCNKLSIKEGFTPVYTIAKTSQVPDDTSDRDDPQWIVTADWSANGYRLPTEAEWEYAARGGDKSMGFLYSGSNRIDEVGWNMYNSDEKTHPVGQKKPNELGIYDMSGNVLEWCWDWFESYTSDNKTNPRGPQSGIGRVIRGGSVYIIEMSCLVAWRNYSDASICYLVGFRVSRTLN